MGIIQIAGVTGAGPSYQLTVDDTTGAQIGDHVAAPLNSPPAGQGGLYRVSGVPDGTHLDVEDDLEPDGGVYGEPGSGAAQFFEPTPNYTLSQSVDGGGYWGVGVRRDLQILDHNLAEAELRTFESFTMTVDYTTGVRPPDGTMVRSQAEYDALGAPLKYLNDAERIRPPIVNHQIIVELAAGTHYADSSVMSPAMYTPTLLLMGFQASSKDFWDFDSFFASGYFARVVFVGATAVVDPGIAGTWSTSTDGRSRLFTRTAGSWTPGEHRGRFADCITGVNAGQRYPIIDNTADTLEFAGSQDSGTGDVDIYELTSTLSALDGPGGDAGYFLIRSSFAGRPSSESYYGFHDLDIGNSGSAETPSVSISGGKTYIRRCKFHNYTRLEVGYFMVSACYWDISAAVKWGLYSYGEGRTYIWMSSCVFRSAAVGGDILYYRTGVYGNLAGCRFIAEPGYAGNMVSLYFSAEMESSGGYTPVWIQGNGEVGCYGVHIVYGPSSFVEREWMCITDCERAVYLHYATHFASKAFRADCENNEYMYYVLSSNNLVVSRHVEASMYNTALVYVDGETFTADDLSSYDTLIGANGTRIKFG